MDDTQFGHDAGLTPWERGPSVRPGRLCRLLVGLGPEVLGRRDGRRCHDAAAGEAAILAATRILAAIDGDGDADKFLGMLEGIVSGRDVEI